MKNLLLSCLLLLCGLVAPSVAEAAAPCAEVTVLPATITVPGNYCLVGNHTVDMTSGAAIEIAANNVSLDCLGQTITNTTTNAANNSWGIYLANRKNATIRNCRVTGGFAIGIYAYQNNAVANQSYYHQVKDNYIAGPYWYGILAYGSAIEIEGNRIYDIGGRTGSAAFGIRVAGSTVAGQPRFFLLRENLVAGTNALPYNAYGIYADNTNAAIVVENGVSGTTGTTSWGIRLGGTYNRVTDNHIVGSGRASDYGIQSNSATDSCFDNYLRTSTGTAGCDASMGNF
jgi:hypothetical protein